MFWAFLPTLNRLVVSMLLCRIRPCSLKVSTLSAQRNRKERRRSWQEAYLNTSTGSRSAVFFVQPLFCCAVATPEGFTVPQAIGVKISFATVADGFVDKRLEHSIGLYLPCGQGELASGEIPKRVIPKRQYGRTKEKLSIIGSGGMVVKDVTPQRGSHLPAYPIRTPRNRY